MTRYYAEVPDKDVFQKKSLVPNTYMMLATLYLTEYPLSTLRGTF
jgi:hypothetical protein